MAGAMAYLNMKTTGPLTYPFYTGEVVGTAVDPDRSGGIKVKISGITDKMKEEDIPWFYPLLGDGMQQVPEKGSKVAVLFIGGDIDQGLYYGVSATKQDLPPQYVADYPNVAVQNMGENGFLYVHNRATHITTITNPGNNSNVVWNAAGEVLMSTTNSSPEQGEESISVLTENTIDVFTCKPIGSPDTAVRQGSEYLKIPHISKSTIEALRGGGAPELVTAQNTEDPMGDGVNVSTVYGVDGEYDIPFEESPAAKKRSGKKLKRLIVGSTGGRPLSEFLGNYLDDGAKSCAHYLVGIGDGAPDVLCELDDRSKAKNLGFIQCVDVKMDATYGSGSIGLSSIGIGDKPNVDAVSAVFYGKGNFNDYQMTKFKDIINHLKKVFNVNGVVVMASNEVMADYENLMQYEGAY